MLKNISGDSFKSVIFPELVAQRFHEYGFTHSKIVGCTTRAFYFLIDGSGFAICSTFPCPIVIWSKSTIFFIIFWDFLMFYRHVLPSETMHDCYLKTWYMQIATSFAEQLRHFLRWGGHWAHTGKEMTFKKYQKRILGNIRKISKPNRMIAQCPPIFRQQTPYQNLVKVTLIK